MAKNPENEQQRMIIQELIRRVNNINRRLKELEQRMDRIEDTTKTVQDQSIKGKKKTNERFSKLKADLEDLSVNVSKIESAYNKFKRRTDQYAKKRDVNELEQMFELLNPVTSRFVTEEKLDEKLKKLEEKMMQKSYK